MIIKLHFRCSPITLPKNCDFSKSAQYCFMNLSNFRKIHGFSFSRTQLQQAQLNEGLVSDPNDKPVSYLKIVRWFDRNLTCKINLYDSVAFIFMIAPTIAASSLIDLQKRRNPRKTVFISVEQQSISLSIFYFRFTRFSCVIFFMVLKNPLSQMNNQIVSNLSFIQTRSCKES